MNVHAEMKLTQLLMGFWYKESRSLIQGATGEPVRVRSTQPRENLKGDSCHSFCHFTETRELPNHLSHFWGFPEHGGSTGSLRRLQEATCTMEQRLSRPEFCRRTRKCLKSQKMGWRRRKREEDRESQSQTACSRLVTVRSYAWITAAWFDILSQNL